MLREINLWEQGHDGDSENVNEIRQQIIRDLDRAALNFGDTTAHGCRPSCQLQFGRQFVLSQPIIGRFDNMRPFASAPVLKSESTGNRMQTGEAQRAARRVNLTIVAKHLTISFLLDDF
jgi:hypothetical protein